MKKNVEICFEQSDGIRATLNPFIHVTFNTINIQRP